MTSIQGAGSWAGGVTPFPEDVPPIKEPGVFGPFINDLERVATDFTDPNTPNSRQEEKQGNGMATSMLFNASGDPKLPPPDEAPDPFERPVSLEKLMADFETSSNKFNSSLINDRANSGYSSMKQRIDNYVAAQLKSIDNLEKASAEHKEKLGKWYYKAIQWASDNFLPYFGLAIAGAMTFATGGAAWPLLALATANVANHVLKQNGIDVIAKVERGVSKLMTPVLGKEAANRLAKNIAAQIGLIVGDPTPLGEFLGSMFADFAKMLGAGKSTIEYCEMAGKILGVVISVAVGVVAGGAGSSVANAMKSALSAVSTAVTAPVATAEAAFKAASEAVKQFFEVLVQSIKHLAKNGGEAISSALKEVGQMIMSSLRDFINTLREALPRIKEGAKSVLNGSNGLSMPRIKDVAKFMPSASDLQGMTAKYGANLTRTVATTMQAGVGGASGVREFDLGLTQKHIDDRTTDRNKIDQLLGSEREKMRMEDQAMQTKLEVVAKSSKARASMIKNYAEGAMERARLIDAQAAAA